MPVQQKNVAGQLQDSKLEISQLKAQLENLSKVNDDLRESQAEIDNLRALLEQAKKAATAVDYKARITDLEKEAEGLRAQVKSVSGQYHEIKSMYDSRIGNVGVMERQLAEAQTRLRIVQEERDALAGTIRNVQQSAAQQVATANQQMTQMNELLRSARLEAQHYKSMVMEARSVIQGNPDVLAAVRQKLGFQN